MDLGAVAIGRGGRLWQARLRGLPHRIPLLGRLVQAVGHSVGSSRGWLRLVLVLVVAGCCLTGATFTGHGAELAERGLTLAKESAQVIAARLAGASPDGCRDQIPLLPLPASGDDGIGPFDQRLVDLSCGDR